jgi:hypothetical protein
MALGAPAAVCDAYFQAGGPELTPFPADVTRAWKVSAGFRHRDMKLSPHRLALGFGCSPRLIFGSSSGPTKNLPDNLISRLTGGA